MTDSTFTFRVDEALKTAFAAAAKANDRNAAQILRDVMRDYVAEAAPPSPAYVAWLQQKVDASWTDYQANGGIPAEEAEAEFARRRAALLDRATSGKAA